MAERTVIYFEGRVIVGEGHIFESEEQFLTDLCRVGACDIEVTMTQTMDPAPSSLPSQERHDG